MLLSWTTEDGLPTNTPNELALGLDGRLWITTYEGVVTFDGAHFVAQSSGSAGIQPNPRALSVARQPGGGLLWVLYDDQRVERVDGEHHAFISQRFAGLAKSRAGVWAFDYDGTLWDLDDWPQEVASLGPYTDALVARDDGSLWVHRRDTGAWHPVDDQHRVVLALPVADRDLISREAGPWTVSDGALLYKGAELLPRSWEVRDLALDGQTLWLTSAGHGLMRLRPRAVDVVLPPEGLDPRADRLWWDERDHMLWARDPRGAWWSVLAEGARLKPPLLAEQPAKPTVGPDWATLPMPDAEGGRWWATEGMIWREDPSTHLLHLAFGANFWRPFEGWRGPGGTLWLGTSHGLFVEEGGGWRSILSAQGESLAMPRAFAALPGSATAVGCAGGVGWVGPDHLQSVLPRPPFPVTVRHLRRQGDWLWAATEERGLCALPLKGAPQAWASPEGWRCVGLGGGLWTQGVHVSIEDLEGRTWVSTNRGLGFAPTTQLTAFAAGLQPKVAFLRLDEEDGMATAEANGHIGGAAWLGADGDLFFPTQVGVARVHPDRVINPHAPVAQIVSVSVAGRRVPARDLEVADPEAVVEVGWGATSLSFAEDVWYRHRLSPQAVWSEPTQSRSVLFPAIPAGFHGFEVQAGIGGIWGPSTTLWIRRLPSFWEREGMLTAVVLGGLGLVLLGVALRLRAGRMREEELERRVQRATEELEAAAQDLTQQNQTLTEQKASLDRQHHQLRAQTEELRALYERSAAQAQRLEALDQMTRSMLVNVSHELRTPLTLVLGPLSAAVDKLAAGPAREAVELAIRNADHLQSRVEDLLRIARAQGGAVPLLARRVDFGRLLRKILRRFSTYGEALTVKLQPPDELPMVWCNPDMIDTVVGNLVANGQEHGGGALEIGVSVKDDGGGQPGVIRVEVRDHGGGLVQGADATLFTRFSHAPSERDRAGLGLGLSLARELIELHGGELGAHNAPKGGAIFWFSLPLGVEHLGLGDVDIDAEPPDADRDAPSLVTSGEVGATVLLVEDHSELRSFLRAHLSARFQTDAVESAEDAVERLGRGGVELLVSDIMLPGMSGLDLVAWVRERPALASLPVLLISARGEVEDRVDGLAMADDYLAKPFALRELIARCSALLRRRVGPAPLTGAASAATAEATDDDCEFSPKDARFLAALESAAAERLADPTYTLDDLAYAVGLSRRSLHERLREMGLDAPGAWLRERRMVRAEMLLAQRSFETVSEVAEAVGLSRAYFSRAYKSRTGRSPGADLRQANER